MAALPPVLHPVLKVVPRPLRNRWVLALGIAIGAALMVLLVNLTGAGRAAPPVAFLETFDGSPGAPQPWHPANWDVTVHSRDLQTWETLDPMAADHGSDCAGPPATHPTNTYEGAVFLCKDHVMTAMSAGGYGAIYLTPPAMMDWSAAAGGESVFRFDMSTLRTSNRDWVDVWIMPFGDNLQFPLDDWLPDGNGNPRRGFQIRANGNDTGMSAFVIRNGEQTELPHTLTTYNQMFAAQGLTSSASRRDTFEIRISRTHLKVLMPAYGLVFVDQSFADLGYDQATVALSHHSYSPHKECTPDPSVGRTCEADTWHWDNVSISPAQPFTILGSDHRYTDAAHPAPIVLAAPAPANAFVRYLALGNALEVSFDGGTVWVPAVRQWQSKNSGDETFKSHWQPIPQGTTQIRFRGQNWWGGGYRAENVTVWSQGTPPPGIASPTPTRTPLPTAIPTSTRTPVPATVVVTGTPTVAPTRTATAVPPTPTSVLSTPTTVPAGTSVPATATVVVAATATPPPAAGALCVRYVVDAGRLVEEQPAGCDPLRRS